jgi:hypothetical protein
VEVLLDEEGAEKVILWQFIDLLFADVFHVSPLPSSSSLPRLGKAPSSRLSLNDSDSGGTDLRLSHSP